MKTFEVSWNYSSCSQIFFLFYTSARNVFTKNLDNDIFSLCTFQAQGTNLLNQNKQLTSVTRQFNVNGVTRCHKLFKKLIEIIK